MFYLIVLIGLVALIAMVLVLLEGVILMLSKNQIRKGLCYIGVSILLGLLAATAGLSILSTMH